MRAGNPQHFRTSHVIADLEQMQKDTAAASLELEKDQG